MVFVDRQSKYPNRWTLKKSDGTSEVVTLIRNDEPTVEGTPMNAATLNELSTVAGALNAKEAAAASAADALASQKAAKTSETNAYDSAFAANNSAVSAAESAKKAASVVSVDKTLTVSGAPADAETVGNELSNRYTIAEVDNLIASSTVETDKTLTVSGAAADAKAAGDAIKAITPTSLGLGNVDNTADSEKNVYYASYAGSASSASSVAWSNVTSRPSTMSNPYSLTIKANGTTQATYDGSSAKSVNITKSSIGLGNVDNTADSDKSVYYATSAGSASSVAWSNVSDRPSSLKNPYSLGIQANGTMLGTYDGSAGKILNITASNVGALESGSSNYVSDVSVSGSTLYITRGDGTYITVALSSGGDIVSKSIGESISYIRMSNGIQICWGFTSYQYITFPVPFVDNNSVGFASHASYSGSTRLVTATKSILSTNFLDWVAIGLWK